MRIYITANSPGEVAGWVQPIVTEIIARAPESEIIMVLLPCQYAGGSEMAVGSNIPGISEVMSLWTLISGLSSKRRTARAEGQHSVVFFLGGDPFYAVLLGKLLYAPVMGYTPRPRRIKHFSHFFLPDNASYQRALADGVAKDKMTVVGHLALDSIGQLRSREVIRAEMGFMPNDMIITFLLGSRPSYVEYMLPFFLPLITKVREQLNCHVLLAISPFIKMQQVKDIIVVEEVSFHEDAGELYLGDNKDCRILFDNPKEAMIIADLAVTIPGTNNLQLAGMGVPFMMVAPLNKAEFLPFDGLIGLLNPRIFPVGYLKRKFMLALNKRIRFVSWPNMIAGREIVPEIRGVLSPEGVFEVLRELLNNHLLREQMSRELLEVTGERGAASTMAAAILAT